MCEMRAPLREELALVVVLIYVLINAKPVSRGKQQHLQILIRKALDLIMHLLQLDLRPRGIDYLWTLLVG